MYRLSFVLIFLVNCLVIKSQPYSTRSSKINLFFNYGRNSANLCSLKITGDTVPKDEARAAYVFTGKAINRSTLNISSIDCKRNAISGLPACPDKTGSNS